MLQAIILAVIAFVAYRTISALVFRVQRSTKAKKLGCRPPPELPSPDPLGIINTLHLVKSNNAGCLLEYIKDRWDRVSKTQGRPVLTISTHILRDPFFMTCDPRNIQAILATQFKEFELGSIRFGTFSPLLGNGIFSADGARWEHSRALLRPQFARDQVSDLELEESHLQNLLLALPTTSGGWTSETDLLPLFFRLTIDSASEFLFGESVDTQVAALPGYTSKVEGGRNGITDAEFVRAFEGSQNLIAQAFRFQNFYWLALGKEYYKECKICHQYIDYFVNKALEHNAAQKHNEKLQVLDKGEKDKYFFLKGLANATADPIEIRDQLLSIMVAGRDTTASLLCFLFQQLAIHTEVFAKLRSEVLENFGTYTSPKNITFASLKSSKYLQWCLNETLRLFPTVPMNSRRSIVDTTLPRGGGPAGTDPIFVPKGTEVNYSVYAMHRQPSLWGPDCEQFKPERWNTRKTGFEYLPFNGGPRICLGQQFALTEAGYIIVRMLQRFDKIDPAGVVNRPKKWVVTLTGRPADGVHMRFHVAKE